ncbi:DUF917 domain-containing protein [Sphingomonas sanxanigenens]|uniref:OsrF n=1 Tax=Sphingomonas sanxanigenens DSM 19645 = NX02 TaxID=1123269 RepID=W0AEH2_9SPHN|nr:DUF917 family protein [Sphingomonas sanxanigenens]AHE54698.1 hypothetical protein NX02_15075 [Sphingomonas sanxanigenens DSM 19645 = NX02]
MRRRLVRDDVEAAVLGGSVFACGGGGWADHGRMLGNAAMDRGSPELVSIDELPGDAWIATAAAIGAPAGTTRWEMRGEDYVRAAALLQEALGAPLAGLIIGQNGMSSTLNGWLPAVELGLVVVDAVGDVRAHPTGDMGSLGLAASPEPMIQTAAGGHRASHAYIELVTRGATAKVSPVLRAAADMSGGFIASCRNPIRAAYVQQHAALGGISLALDLGEAIRDAQTRGGEAVVDAICASTGGRILARGRVTKKAVHYTAQAFDIGTIAIDNGGTGMLLHVMNEYMAVGDMAGARLATYPDVITTLTPDGVPVSVGQVEEGAELLVFHIAKDLIPLSSSVRDASVYPVVEQALGIAIADHALA